MSPKRPADEVPDHGEAKRVCVSRNGLVESALRIVVGREIAMRQGLVPRGVAGRELVRLAIASCNRAATKRALGLTGDFPILMLRWGHCAKFIQKSLTCCPERREVLATCDPTVIADHIERAGTPRPWVGMPPLVDVLLSGDLLRKVDTEWLVARMPSDYWLAYAMDRAGLMAGVTPDWILEHMKTDSARDLALRTGGFIKDRRVTRDFLATAIKNPAKLTGCLADLGAPCPRDFLAATFKRFGDYMNAFMLWHAPTASQVQVVEDFNRWYRNHDEAPEDLALELVRLNHSGYADVAPVGAQAMLKNLRGVPCPLVVDVIMSCDRLPGLEEWLAEGSHGESMYDDCMREVKAMGWSDEDADDIADVIVSHPAA
jgi:hypothetical protein